MSDLNLKKSPILYEKPLLGFAAFSGTGKTTLLLKLIPELKQKGLRIAVVKHAHHNFDMDTPGKDSYELRKAGTRQMVLASPMRTSLIIEHPVYETARQRLFCEQAPTRVGKLTHEPIGDQFRKALQRTDVGGQADVLQPQAVGVTSTAVGP